MATIADELLNDFEESGSENEDEQTNRQIFDDHGGTEQDTVAGQPSGSGQNGSMVLDGDEEEPDEEDLAGGVPSHLKMDDPEDEEETKARVEKMELHNVGDVRSVAGLMKQLEPIIKVSRPHTSKIVPVITVKHRFKQL